MAGQQGAQLIKVHARLKHEPDTPDNERIRQELESIILTFSQLKLII
jgi:hypothetical protein